MVRRRSPAAPGCRKCGRRGTRKCGPTWRLLTPPPRNAQPRAGFSGGRPASPWRGTRIPARIYRGYADGSSTPTGEWNDGLRKRCARSRDCRCSIIPLWSRRGGSCGASSATSPATAAGRARPTCRQAAIRDRAPGRNCRPRSSHPVGSRARPGGETGRRARAASRVPRTTHRARSRAGRSARPTVPPACSFPIPSFRKRRRAASMLAKLRGHRSENAPPADACHRIALQPSSNCSAKSAAIVGCRRRLGGALMPQILFKNMNLLDPRWNEARGGYEVLVEGDLIKEVSTKPIKAAKAQVVDCGKRTLMPGLIDCHVHVFLVEVNIRNLEHVPLTLLTARSADLMKGMINRGFTTVRDTGGADWGIKTAVESGLIPGPRLFISGRAIGPTGGHSDSRRRTDTGAPCGCCNAMVFTMALADGPDEVRRSAREQMRQGADQVKIMM